LSQNYEGKNMNKHKKKMINKGLKKDKIRDYIASVINLGEE